MCVSVSVNVCVCVLIEEDTSKAFTVLLKVSNHFCLSSFVEWLIPNKV